MPFFSRHQSPFVPLSWSNAKDGLGEAISGSPNFTDVISNWGKRGGGRSRTQTDPGDEVDPLDPMTASASPFAPIPSPRGSEGSDRGYSGSPGPTGPNSLGGSIAGGYTGSGSPSGAPGGQSTTSGTSAPGSTTSGSSGAGTTTGGAPGRGASIGGTVEGTPARGASIGSTVQGPAAPIGRDDDLATAGQQARSGIADMANNRDRADAVLRSELDPNWAAPAPSPFGSPVGDMTRTQNGVSLPDPNAPPTIDVDQMYGPTRAEMSPNISIANVRSVGMEEAIAAREAAAMKADREMHEAKPEDERAPALKSGPDLAWQGIDVDAWANNTKEVEDALAAATQAAPFSGAPDVVGLGPQDKVEDLGPLGPAAPAPASWDTIEASLKDMETRSAELDARQAARDAELAQLAAEKYGLEVGIGAQQGAVTGSNAGPSRAGTSQRDEEEAQQQEQQSPLTNTGPLSGFQEAIESYTNEALAQGLGLGQQSVSPAANNFADAFGAAFGGHTGYGLGYGYGDNFAPQSYGYGVQSGLRDAYGNTPFSGETVTGPGAASGPKGPMGLGIDEDQQATPSVRPDSVRPGDVNYTLDESQVDPTNNYNNNLVNSIEDMFGGIGNISNQGQRSDMIDAMPDMFGVRDDDMVGLPGMSDTSRPSSPFGPGPEMDKAQPAQDDIDRSEDLTADPTGLRDSYEGAPVGLGMGSNMGFGSLTSADMAGFADALGNSVAGPGGFEGGFTDGVGESGLTDAAYGGIDTGAFGDIGAFGGWGGFDGFGGFDGMGGGFDGGGGNDTGDDDDDSGDSDW